MTPLQQIATWPAPPAHPPAEATETEVEEQRREAALATRRVRRPAQWSAMETDDARLLPELDAVYAWTSRDRVIIERMPTFLGRERQSVLVEVEELDIHMFLYVKFDRC